MHVTMVKKRLASGEPCKKCIQAEELLKNRGLWDRVDGVVWADESDPSSPGMQLAARFGVQLAPFFVVREDDGTEKVYESVIPRNVRLGEAPSFGKPIILYDIRSRGSEAYINFAKEFIRRAETVL